MENTLIGSSDSVPDVLTDASMEEKKTVDIPEHDVATDSAVAEHKTEAVVETAHPTGETKVPMAIAHIEVVASPLFRGDVIQRELYESAAPKSPVVDEEERPMDKRSGLVDRHRQLKQVLLYCHMIYPSFISTSDALSLSFSRTSRCCVIETVTVPPYHLTHFHTYLSCYFSYPLSLCLFFFHHQVLCYICCAEFGTTSLVIHQKTCLKKHAWGLENNILHEPGGVCVVRLCV